MKKKKKKKFPKQTKSGCILCGVPFKINQRTGEKIAHRHDIYL